MEATSPQSRRITIGASGVRNRRVAVYHGRAVRHLDYHYPDNHYLDNHYLDYHYLDYDHDYERDQIT